MTWSRPTEATEPGGAGRRLVLVAALAAAAILVLLAISPQTAQAQEPGALYIGRIDRPALGDNCGNGRIFIALDDGRTVITHVGFSGFAIGGGLYPYLNNLFDIDLHIPIATDGSFDGLPPFEPADSTTAHFRGRFTGDTVVGTIESERQQCGPLGFSAERADYAIFNAKYHGEISSQGNCGGGTIDVTVGPGEYVSAIQIASASAQGTAISAAIEFDRDAIDGGGVFIRTSVPYSFNVYFPDSTGGYEITVSGTFVGEKLSGELTISPSTCGAIPFSATAPTAIAPTPQVIGLPVDGGGRPDGSGGVSRWSAIFGAVGIVALGAAWVVRKRHIA